MVNVLEIFLEFVKIGAFMFGGGYAGIALVYKELVEIKGWISEEELLEMIGVSESTPGPFAINLATYVGYRVGGLPGSLAATLGVVFIPYITIVSIATALLKYFLNPAVRSFFRGVNAAVIALILYALIVLGRTTLVDSSTGYPNLVTIAIFLVSFATLVAFKLHPALIILIAGALSLALKLLLNV